MPSSCTTSPSCAARTSRADTDASALVLVLLLVSVLSVVAGSLLLTTSARYHTTFQSASWQESIVGAEAGIDMAMNELRKRVTVGAGTAFSTNWTTKSPAGSPYPNYGHAFPASNQAYTLSTHTGEGNSAMQARVYLDVPGSSVTPTVNFAVPPDSSNSTFISQLDNPSLRDPDGVDRSRWWYRIRALGTAGLSGPPIANLQKLDNRLRRFSFFSDWRTGRAVSTPQVSRLVEVTAKPLTNFRNALMADKQINLSNQDVLVDSYDSSKGNYSSAANHGQMGNVATNGTLINANNATVNGDAMTNNGTVKAGDNVTGQQSSNFFQELTPITPGMLNPAWSGVPSGGTVTSSATYQASTDSTNPTLVRLDGINLPSGGNVININAPDGATAATPSFIKIYVQGDIATNDDSFINLDPGVNAIVYFTGNVDLEGNGIFNNSMLASHLVLNGVQPPANPDGTYPSRNLTVSTYQDLEAIVYAPNHDLNLALQAAPAPGTTAPSGPSGGPAPPPPPGAPPKQLKKLQDDQNKAKDDFNKALSNYQQDMSVLGLLAPAINLVVSPVASNLTAMLPAPNGKTASDVAKLQNALNKVSQTEAQIESLQGTLTTSQTDDHARGYNGIYGGFVAKTITIANKTHIHYDETLRQAGPVNHYQIVSWFEDNASRDATGGKELFWWPGGTP